MEKRMGNIAGNLEYQASLDVALNQEAKLRESMNAAQLQALNLLLSEVSSLNALENEQIFREALRLARELNVPAIA